MAGKANRWGWAMQARAIEAIKHPADGVAVAGRRLAEGTMQPRPEPDPGAVQVWSLILGGLILGAGTVWAARSRKPAKPAWSLSNLSMPTFSLPSGLVRPAPRRTGLGTKIGLGSLAVAGAAGLGVALARFMPQIAEALASREGRPHFLQGAEASDPTGIPPGGWWDITQRTYNEIGRDRVLAVSAGVTFYAILALFPAMTAFVSLYGLFADTATIGAHLSLMQGFLPDGALSFVGDEITRIAGSNDTTLSLAFILAILVSLWSANAGAKALIEALNVAYGEDEKRGFVRLNLISLAFTAGLIAFILVALAGIAGVPVLLDWLYLGDRAEWIIWLGRWPALLLVLILGLSILYRFGPSRDDAKWRWVSPGALFASIAWLVGSMLFSWYVANFANYNATYGALGALVAMLIWIWLSATIIVLGAEINSEAERQTLRDTTVGTPMPMGLRGAEAADNKIGAKSR